MWTWWPRPRVPEPLLSTNPVVSDTSPLISLAAVGRLSVLGDLYGEILVPDLVRDEYEIGRLASELTLAECPWIVVVRVNPNPSLPVALDPGETAAMSLALELSARAILLDERLGRRQAAQLGLPVVGTLGVLLRAKEQGLIPAVTPIVDEMIAHGIRIGTALRTLTLQQSGEYS